VFAQAGDSIPARDGSAAVVKGRYEGAEDTTLAYVVLGYEDTGCYVFSSSLMKDREQVYRISALTTIKSRPVTVHLSRRFAGLDLLKGNAWK
jgi:hypothetical protein